MFLTDLDFPHDESKTYKQYSHWLVANIPVGKGPLVARELGTELLAYMPPLPSDGTGVEGNRHRFLFAALWHPQKMDPSGSIDRWTPLAQHVKALNGSVVGLNFMFCFWTEGTSILYEELYGNCLGCPL